MDNNNIEVMGHNLKVNEVIEPREIVGGSNSIEKALLCNGLIKKLTKYISTKNNLILLQLKNGKIVVVELHNNIVKYKMLMINLFTSKGCTLIKNDINEIKESIEKYINNNNNNVIKVKLHSMDKYDSIENIVVIDKAKSVVIGEYTPKLYEIWNRNSCNISDDGFKSYIKTFEKTFNNLTLMEFVKDEVYAFVPKSKFFKEDVKITLKVVDASITITKDRHLLHNLRYIDLNKIKQDLVEKITNIYKQPIPTITLTFVDAISPVDKLKALIKGLPKDGETCRVTLNNETYILESYFK